MTDPIHHARRRTIYTWLIASPAIIAIAAWSLAPIDHPDLGELHLDAGQTTTDETVDGKPLDLAGFHAPIWQDPVEEPSGTLATTQPPPPVPFPDLQLIAIVRDGEVYRAALYIPDIDELVIAARGETIGDHLALTVSTVTSDAVELTRAGRTKRIELKKPEIVKLGIAG